MKREYYSSSIEKFKSEDIDSVLGKLLINDEFKKQLICKKMHGGKK